MHADHNTWTMPWQFDGLECDILQEQLHKHMKGEKGKDMSTERKKCRGPPLSCPLMLLDMFMGPSQRESGINCRSNQAWQAEVWHSLYDEQISWSHIFSRTISSKLKRGTHGTCTLPLRGETATSRYVEFGNTHLVKP